MNKWNIFYRGSLASCNYQCGYCPFAKRPQGRVELQQDEFELQRFVDWVAAQHHRLGILITPWGEALIHSYYRRALTLLSHLPQVTRIAIQTNLSAPLDDILEANRNTIALWTTFHPSQFSPAQFASRCRILTEAGIRYSVGVVGLREHWEPTLELRRLLPNEVYLWINAFKRAANYYQPDDLARWLTIDPYFHWNLKTYPGGHPCAAGNASFAVSGDGNIRRCHFINDIIGNIYDAEFAVCLKERECSATDCDCHIGYIHRPELQLHKLYGQGLLERIPSQWPVMNDRFQYDKQQLKRV